MKKISKILVSVFLILNIVIMAPIMFLEKGYTVEASTIRLNYTKRTMYVGGFYWLKITGTNKKVTWKSSDKKIATVSSEGKVRAKKKGTCIITATVKKKEYKCKINVKDLPKESKSTKGVIYLTFDDGPSSAITPKVLDILKKENIKATFFVLNYSKANEKYIKRIVREGHTIGIHGYSHQYSKIYKSRAAFLNNVYSLRDKIKKSTGVSTRYIRFPGGSSNTISRHYRRGIMKDLTKAMLGRGFKYYDWNVCAEDAGSARNSTQVYNYVVKNLSKQRGNMVLMHDFYSNKKGLEALPKIIKYAKKHGYKFAAIDDSTPMYAQHVNN